MAAEFLSDPCEFQRHWIGRSLWLKQREILHSVANNPLTAVKGCHASGKTFAAAGLPLWWMVRWAQAKCFVTAPTERQVKTFWKDVAVAYGAGRVSQLLTKPPSVMALNVNAERYAYGASASAGVNIQGLHSPKVLIIADEAPGIGGEIWDALEGIRAGGDVHVLEMGNPVIPSGHFYDAFGKSKGIYKTFSISAFDTPNFAHEVTGDPITMEDLLTMSEDRLDYKPVPSLIRRRWVKERYHVWGPEHPQFRSRVLAEFPNDDPYSVFPLAWIEKATREPNEADLAQAKKHFIQVGIDVAGAGSDETVLVARVGGIVLCTHAWPDGDPRGAVVNILGALKHRRDYQLGRVVIDDIGVGYNFAKHIADQGFDVWGFGNNRLPIDREHYRDQTAEAHFTLREWLREGMVSGIEDLETQAQMSSIRYREDSRGLVQIESKDDRNKRGIPGSPDRDEAMVMAFARIVPQSQVITHDECYEISRY